MEDCKHLSEIAAIVPAAGTGERMNSRTPKAFIKLRGMPMAYYTIRALSSVEGIEKIVFAAPPDWKHKAEEAASDWGFKNLEIIQGGATRQETVYMALKTLPADTKMVVIHDGARPLATPALIRAVIECAQEHGACIPTLPCEETVKRVRGNNVIETLDRSEIHIVQTPQAFYFETILEAHRHADERKWRVTDDATLIERAGRPVATVPGEYSNIKITRPADLKLVKSFFPKIIS